MNKDRIIYIDTDSCYLSISDFILDNISDKDKWLKLSDKDKITYIKRISNEIIKYVNDNIYEKTQLNNYNSQVRDFKIRFEYEAIYKTMLAIKKKKYACWMVDKEGIPTDKIKVTGLEIVRSESAEAIRPRLKSIMEMIMKQEPDDEIGKTFRKYKKELNALSPEELAANIGINGIRKYLGGGTPKKGTPWHVKGVYGYRSLLDRLELKDKYEDIQEGLKAKVIYVKKNPYNVETITFYEWPNEFDGIIQFDPETMIDKFFVKKVRLLLNSIGKEHIIDSDMSAVSAFF